MLTRNAIILLGLTVWSVGASAQRTIPPPDVPSTHWAASDVQQTLRSGVLTTMVGGRFAGTVLVTRTQAAIALANLAQKLEADTWPKQPSHALPQNTNTLWETGNWQKQPITRYVLASVLASAGNYYVNSGAPRPPKNSKDVGHSEAILPAPKIKLSPAHPAYAALTYLARNRMVAPLSPLLKADNRTLRGEELSRALTDMISGLNDRLTEMGRDAQGNTPDASFHTHEKKPKPESKP